MKVITIHGIRRSHRWYETLTGFDAWGKAEVNIVNFEYGYFTFGSFCLWWRRKRAVNEFLEFYQKNVRDGEIPSVVAHSFGTYILFKALKKHSVIKVNRVVLSGCILAQGTNWEPFFRNGQVNYILNDIGENDTAVSLSGFIIPLTCGTSGKNGFVIKNSYKKRMTEKRNAFDHSDGFYEKHMKNVWVPFLLKDVKKFVYDEHILSKTIIERIYNNGIGKVFRIQEAQFNARIDINGSYFANYELVLQNNSATPQGYIEIKTSADSIVSAETMNFKAFDDQDISLAVDIQKDIKQFKCFQIHFNTNIQSGRTTKINYRFKWLQTMSFEGDTDHWHISNFDLVKVNLNFVRKLVDPKFYVVKQNKVIKELDSAYKLEKDGSFSYSIDFDNSEGADGLIFYYKKSVKRRPNVSAKSVLKNFGGDDYQLTKCSDLHIKQVHDIERRVEDKLTAPKDAIIERRDLFNDGFLVALNSKKNVVAYIESVIWNNEHFDSFEDIKDFSTHFDINGKILYVIFLAVAENERNKGIATWLLEEIEKIALRYDLNTIALVAKSNLKEFYRKRGYNEIKELPDFLPEREYPSVYMTKNLN